MNNSFIKPNNYELRFNQDLRNSESELYSLKSPIEYPGISNIMYLPLDFISGYVTEKYKIFRRSAIDFYDWFLKQTPKIAQYTSPMQRSIL